MGPLAARKSKAVLTNAQTILAIEALAASQALEFRKPLKPGKGPAALLEFIRERVPPIEGDRYFHEDIEKLNHSIQSGEMVEALHSRGIL